MLMFTREGSSCNNNRRLAGQMFTRDIAGIHCIFRSGTNHYYQRLVNSKFLLHIYRPRKLKTFEAVMWLPPIAQKPRTDARFIANALLFSVIRNVRLVSCNGQLSLEHPSGPKFVNFRKFNISMTSHRFVDLPLESFTGYNSVAMELLPYFSVLAFQIFKRFFCNFWLPCTNCWCGNRQPGRIWRLAAHSTPSAIAPGQSKSPFVIWTSRNQKFRKFTFF